MSSPHADDGLRTTTATRSRDPAWAATEMMPRSRRTPDDASLLKVYRIWQANATAYRGVPFYEGVTLKERLRQWGSPPAERCLLALLASLTDALTISHAPNTACIATSRPTTS